MVEKSATSFISYKLSGIYKIDTPIYIKDIPDINRRAAIIMACHLFHLSQKSSDKCYKDFRASVAAGIYKRMSDYVQPVQTTSSTRDLQTTSISSWHLLLDSKCYVVHDEQAYNWTGSERLTSKVSGCLEMVVANKFIVVSYNVQIDCDTTRLQSLDGYKIVPEPHHSWAELIEDVDKTHEPERRYFSGAIADLAITMNPGYRTIDYVQQNEPKEVLPRYFFSLNK